MKSCPSKRMAREKHGEVQVKKKIWKCSTWAALWLDRSPIQIISAQSLPTYGWAELTLPHCELTTHHYFRVPQFVSEFYPSLL